MYVTPDVTDGSENAVVVVDAVAGAQVQTEKVWKFANEYALPRVVVINRLDRERAEAYRQRFVRAEQIIEPDHATSAAARHLKINAKSPILRVKRVYYTHANRPIEVAYVRYHPDRYRFAIEFKE